MRRSSHRSIRKPTDNNTRSYTLVPLGDKAVLVDFCETLDLEANIHIQRVAKAIQLRRPPWLLDVVPALGSLAIHADRAKLASGEALPAACEVLLSQCLARELPDLDQLGRVVELPVCYEGDLAPDMEDVAKRCNLAVEEVIRRHVASLHRVLMVGFVPGHPYIGGSDPGLSVPRRATPRQRVTAGSVAIANCQTVVYPFASPSGWSIVGRTCERIFDPTWPQPALMAPGDRVRFVPIGRQEFDQRWRERER